MKMGLFNLIQKQEEAPIVRDIVKREKKLKKLKLHNHPSKKIKAEIARIEKEKELHIKKLETKRKNTIWIKPPEDKPQDIEKDIKHVRK